MTGLGNRRFLNARLEEMIEARQESGPEIAALHIDLDRFKQINDTMGHAAGDHVLRSVADILRKKVRKEDTVARIGGDEFIVLMNCTADSDMPDVLADRLIEEICRPIPYEDRLCRLGASIGIARTPVIPAGELLTCSDNALYKAKTGGRAMKAVFNEVDLEAMKLAKKLGEDILRGLENQEFIPYYQPQIDASTGSIAALEVLARWDHPERGLLDPAEFQDIASDIQVDGELDRIVFDRAVEECRAQFEGLRDAPILSFNVSLCRLMHPGLPEMIAGLDFPGRIAFELVETVYLDEEKSSFLERIEELRRLGVMFELDDFGSGRASIVGLRRIAPERLKIDSRLIEPIITSESASRLVRSIIEIGRALDIGITAEGVETAAHVSELIRLGCDRMQGYHFAGPAPLQQAMELGPNAGSKKQARA